MRPIVNNQPLLRPSSVVCMSVCRSDFVLTIAIRQLVMEGGWVVGRQNADIADTLQLTDVAMATIFGFLYMGCTLSPPGEYDWNVHVRRRCGLMSNYLHGLLVIDGVWRHMSWSQTCIELSYEMNSLHTANADSTKLYRVARCELWTIKRVKK